jgi:hypothetical protein
MGYQLPIIFYISWFFQNPYRYIHRNPPATGILTLKMDVMCTSEAIAMLLMFSV